MTSSYAWPRRLLKCRGHFFALLCLLTLWGCENAAVQVELDTIELEPTIMLTFHFQEEQAHMRMLNFNTLESLSGEEQVDLSESFERNDTLIVPFTVFDAEFRFHEYSDTLVGYWHNLRKGEKGKVPVSGYASKTRAWDEEGFSPIKRYAVSFSPGSEEDEYPAVAEFRRKDGQIKGTFMTETGDYRFLNGTIDDADQFNVYTFDGAHLFHFKGELNDSLISGVFRSSLKWNEPFTGRFDEGATLAHPDSIVQLTGEPFSISVRSLEGDSVLFNQESLKGKVSIVQILGTWCPNCLDESRYYKDLSAQHGVDLQIIPVAFEAYEDFDRSAAVLKKYQSSLDLGYDMYYGGPLSKPKATELFTMIDRVRSFPTSIFLDKQGRVRKIHSGFYGPGTGKYYDDYVVEMDAFIEGLLKEDL